MSTATEEKAEQKKPDVQEPETQDLPGFSLDSFYNRNEQKQEEADASTATTPVEEPSPSVEAKATDTKEVSVTPGQEAQLEEGQQEESETPKKPMSKVERDKFKLREAKRKAEAELQQVKAEVQELREKYGEESLASTEDDEAARIRLEERVKISASMFRDRHGEQVMQEKITGDDAPWKDIEALGRNGDLAALSKLNRAQNAPDPFQEALAILEEDDIFDTYETRSISELVKKVKVEQEAATREAVLAELSPTRTDVGKPVKTLGEVGGEPQATSPQPPEEFSLSGYYKRK